LKVLEQLVELGPCGLGGCNREREATLGPRERARASYELVADGAERAEGEDGGSGRRGGAAFGLGAQLQLASEVVREHRRPAAASQAAEAATLGPSADRDPRASGAGAQGQPVALDGPSSAGHAWSQRSAEPSADQGAPVVPGRARRRPVDGRRDARPAGAHGLGSAQELPAEHNGRGDAGDGEQRLLPGRGGQASRAASDGGAAGARPTAGLQRIGSPTVAPASPLRLHEPGRALETREDSRGLTPTRKARDPNRLTRKDARCRGVGITGL